MEVKTTVSAQQDHAIFSELDPSVLLSIMAGPGCGKTHTLANRILFALSQGIPPEEILVLSFTNRAVTNIKEKLLSILLGSVDPQHAKGLVEHINIVTFNAFEYKVVQLQDPGSPIKVLSTSTLETIGFLRQDEPKIINLVLNELSSSDPVTENARLYIDDLRNYGFTTLPLIGVKAAEILEADLFDFNYRFVLVDEFQDVYPQLFRLIDHIRQLPSVHLTIAGDENQSIYGFMGAFDAYQLLRSIPDASIKQIHLTHSFRSSPEVLELSNQLSSLKLEGSESGGPVKPGAVIKLFFDTSERNEFILEEIDKLRQESSNKLASRDFMVLGRTRKQVKEFVSAASFYRAELNVQSLSSSFLPKTSKFIDILKVFNDPNKHEFSLLTCLSIIPRMSKKTVNDALAASKHNGANTLWACVQNSKSATMKRVFKALSSRVEFYNDPKNSNILNDPSFILLDILSYVEEVNCQKKVVNQKDSFEEAVLEFKSLLDEASSRRLALEDADKILLPEFVLKGFAETYYFSNRKESASINFDGIKALTIHTSKGLESPVVFVMAKHRFEDLVKFRKLGISEELNVFDRIDQELVRTYYVALSRAKHRVYYLEAANESTYLSQSIGPTFLPKRAYHTQCFKSAGLSRTTHNELRRLQGKPCHHRLFLPILGVLRRLPIK